MSECQRDPQDWPHVESWIAIQRRIPSGEQPSRDARAIFRYEVHVCGNPWKCWVFLRLLTGDGLEGVGECSLNGFAKTTVACIEELSRYFLGKRPEEYATITQRMLTDLYSDAGQLHRGVIAAVEMACLDILGKRAGLPVYALLGGKVRAEVPAYANGWYRVERTHEGFMRAADKVRAAGYGTMKLDPFGALTSPLYDELTWSRIVMEMGLQHRFILECHQRLDYTDARLIYADMTRSGSCLWIEEPLRHTMLNEQIALASANGVPIGLGENLTRTNEFDYLVNRTHNLIFQPDVMNLGGITKALEVCRLAERHGLRVCPHDAQGPVSRAACVQLAALSPAVWMLEDFDPWNAPWTQEIATTFRAEKGTIGFKSMPPGLGVTINWDKVREHPYDPNGWVPLFETGWEKRREHV